MAKLKVHRAFDEFLLDPNLSLRAKGFLAMVLTNNITHGIEIKEHCTDLWMILKIKINLKWVFIVYKGANYGKIDARKF